MSKLDELIAELCPDGVEYIPLGEVLKNNNAPNSISKKYYKENGTIPIIDQSQVYIAGYTDEESAVPPILPCIIFGDHTRVVKYADRKFAQGDSGTKVFIPVTEDLKYIYYAFCNIDIPSRGYNRHWTIAKNIKIPLPSLPVQQEIVRILDNFTELTAELTTELTARRKQYEYYRDLLLTFDDEVEWIKLGEIADVTKLAGFEFTEHVRYSDSGKIIALRGLNVKDGRLDLSQVKYIDGSNFQKLSRSKLIIGDMLFTYVGTVGQVALIDKNDTYYLAPNVARIRFDAKSINPNFMRYYFQTNHFVRKQINRYMKSSSMKNLTMENIRKFLVPIPPLEEQKRIVAILDRFDALCNDLTSGLPAEIEARQKQYEYYRDKLLSFKEVKA